MKKQLYTLGMLAFLGLGTFVNAQVGINEENPKATLDVMAKTTSGNTAEGILIPRVSESKAEAMGGNTAESTLIYIDDATDAGTKTYTAKVDTKGYYYFDGTEWQKVGCNKVATLATITGSIRKVEHIRTSDWTEGTFALIQTGGEEVELPDPAAYKNRIIAIVNDYYVTIRYAPPYAPKRSRGFSAGLGQILMSDGKEWYLIAGGI